MEKRTYHEDYEELKPYWKQIRTFVKGRHEVRKYLQDVTCDASPEGVKRNKDYKARAKYVNYPKRTRDAFVGSVFRIPAAVTLPPELEYLKDDANGAGMTLEQVAKGTVTDLIEVGRCGLFVDYGDNAKILTYAAHNCTNWETDKAGRLSLVELETEDEQIKRLYLDENGFYAVDIFEEFNDSDFEMVQIGETVYPTKSDGSKFTEIPFIFVGSTDNSPEPDEMPLWPIVDVTHGHYQNSADYEDLLRYLIPTPAITVPDSTWLKDMIPSGVYTFGDGSIIPLPQNGTAMLLQANANQMHSEAMRDKEAQLVALGARIITGSNGTQRTAEEARITYSSENSILDNLAGNASDAFKRALKWCAEFMGANTDEISYLLNREFFDSSVSPQEITAGVLLLDRQMIAKKDLRDYLRKSGFIEPARTDEEIDAEIEEMGGGL